MENYNFERRYYLSELFFKESTESLALIMFYISMTNFVLACIIIVVIITQTPASMKSFRNLVLALLSVSIMYEIVNTFYKPTILLPLPIIIPVYQIPGITNALSYIGPHIVVLLYMLIVIDLLLCMIIQRYFTMSNLAISHPPYFEKVVYGFICLTNFVMAFSALFGNFSNDRLNKKDTIAFLQKNIFDWQALLDIAEYPTVLTVFISSGFLATFQQIFLIIFGISRFLAIIFFTHKNIKMVIGTKETKQNSKQHQMIIKLLKFEFLAVLIFIFIPSCLLIFSIAIQLPSPLFPLYCNLLIKLYPLIDILLTSILIKPYRKFFKKIFYKIFRLKFGEIEDSSSMPPLTTNKKHNIKNNIVVSNHK